MDTAPITIVIADDHAVVRSGLCMLLEAEHGFEVVAQAGDVPSALRYVRAHRPTVLILDLNMPGEPSLPAIQTVHEVSPDTRVVVLTMQSDPSFAREALRGGAAGYVLKEAADAELVEAVRLAAEGKTYLNPGLGAKLAAEPPEPAGPPDDLTDREVEVLRLIALGHTNTEIAGQPARGGPTSGEGRHARQPDTPMAKNALTTVALLGSALVNAVSLHNALAGLIYAVGAGGAFGFGVGHLIAALLGIRDKYADRMVQAWIAACVALALGYWILFVITGWKGP